MSPSPRAEHDLTQFDKSVDAIVYLLSRPSHRLLEVDELRRAIESPAPAQYHGLAGYEKWLQGIHDLLLEKDILHDEEVMLRCAAVREELGREALTAKHADGDTHAPISDRGPEPSFDYLVLERAIRELLVAKGVFTVDEWRLAARALLTPPSPPAGDFLKARP